VEKEMIEPCSHRLIELLRNLLFRAKHSVCDLEGMLKTEMEPICKRCTIKQVCWATAFSHLSLLAGSCRNKSWSARRNPSRKAKVL
jgi:hypothetical protein